MRTFAARLLILFSIFFSSTVLAEDVRLQWDASASPDVEGYNMYRSTTPGSGYVKLNSALISGLTYTDTTAQEGVTYYYVCTAVRNDLESGYSNQVDWKVPWVTPPNPPSNLSIIVQGANNYLNWDPVDGVDRYLVSFSDNERGPWNLAYTTTDTTYGFKAHPNSGPNYISVQSVKDGFSSDYAVIRRR